MTDKKKHTPSSSEEEKDTAETFNQEHSSQREDLIEEADNKEVLDKGPVGEESLEEGTPEESLEDIPAAETLAEPPLEEPLKEGEQKTDTQETTEKRSQPTLSPARRFLNGFDTFYEVTKRVLFVLILFLIIGGFFAAGAGAGYFASLVQGKEIPPLDEMRKEVSDVTVSSRMYYGSGELISDLRADLKRTPVQLDAVSPLIKKALVATEDEYFYTHKGVVPKAIVRALYQEFSGSASTSGGSTLTQQLIKQQILTNEVSFERKANEILLALRLENTMDKDEILQAYLNVSPFGRNNRGNNIAGVQEATQGIFGVDPDKVTLPQAAFIAGLPQSPIAYTPYDQYGNLKEKQDAGIRRQKDVLYRMFREEYITREEYDEAKDYDITQDFLSSEDAEKIDHSYVYDAVEKEARKIIMAKLYTEDGKTAEELSEDPELYDKYYEHADETMRHKGYKIYSTIDKTVHESLEAVAYENKDKLGLPREITWKDKESGETQQMTEYAQNSSVALDNSSGQIIGFVGGIDYELSQFNMALDSRRSPGSIIKPLLVYGPALDIGLITPASISPDTEYKVVDYSGGSKGQHSIQNAGRTTNEWMTAREALYRSQNIPTAKFYADLIKKINPTSYLRNAGLGPKAIEDNEYTNPSLSIGGSKYGPTNMELTSAFASIANGGVHIEPYLIEKIENNKGEVIYQHERKEMRVYSPQTAFLLQDMLRDVMSKGTARGTKERLNFNADIISKTGTTQYTRDVWYIASTPNITVSSWLGYENKIKHSSLSDHEFGMSASLRNRLQWARLMNRLYELNPTIVGTGERFQQPDGIKKESVLKSTGMKPGKTKTTDGKEVSISGDTFSEYFNTSFLPGTTTYNFAFGATPEELSKFWGGKAREEEEDKDKEKEEQEKKEKEEKDKKEKEKEKEENEQKKKEEAKKKEEQKKKEEEEKEAKKKKEQEEKERKKREEEERKKKEEEEKKKQEEKDKQNSGSNSGD